MSDSAVTVKVRKVLSNPLLGRKQLVSVWALPLPPPASPWQLRARPRQGGALGLLRLLPGLAAAGQPDQQLPQRLP